MRGVALFLSVSIVLLTACDDEPFTSPTTDKLRPQFSGDNCQFFMDSFDECWVADYSGSDEQSHMAEYVGAGNPNYPAWNGEIEVQGGMYVCPSWWDLPSFRVRIIQNGESVYFKAVGRAYLDPSIFIPPEGNIPRAAYTTPSGQIRDQTGRYVAQGGHIYARCFVKQVWGARGNVLAYVGPIVSFNFTGTIMHNPNGGPTGGGRGWAYKDDQVYVENGVGPGWREALDRFLSGGGCTQGYEIWVDGTLKCDANGNLI